MSLPRLKKSSLREGYFLSSAGLHQLQKRQSHVDLSLPSSSPKKRRSDSPSTNLTPNTSTSHEPHAPFLEPKLPQTPHKAALLLIAASDGLLDAAHQNVAQSLTNQGRQEYCKLVLTAIKCLLLAIRNYADHLSTFVLAVAKYKLARIYHYETANAELAQEYANQANLTSSNHGFFKLKVASDVLLARIMDTGDTAFYTRFLDSRIADYKTRRCKGATSIFMVCKLDFLLKQDPNAALALLQEMCVDRLLDQTYKTLCVLLQTSLFLLRGSLVHAKQLLEIAQSLLERKRLHPLQFKAMRLLLSLIHSMRAGDTISVQQYTRELNLFIRIQQDKHWTGWESNGMIPVTIDISTENAPAKLDCLIQWLSHKDFMLTFNLIAGVSLLRQPSQKRNKSIVALQKTDAIASSLLRSMTDMRKSRATDMKHAFRSLCRLQYVRYTIHIYQTWAGFLDGDFDAIKHMNRFMQSVNKRQLLSLELLYFPMILPRLFYIFAVFYHYHGDLQMSKYYYMRVRNAVCEPLSSDRTERSRAQWEIGVGSENLRGCEFLNELYVYSTMHLVLLNEYECKQLSINSRKLADPQLRLNNVLYRNLMALFAENLSLNKFNVGFAKSDNAAALSYYAILSIFSSSPNKATHSTNPALNLLRGKMLLFESDFCFPFFQALVNFLLYNARENSQEFESLFEYCKTVVSSPATTDLERSLFSLILKSLVTDFTKANESHKASVAQMQSEQYQAEIGEKIKLLRSSIKVESSDAT